MTSDCDAHGDTIRYRCQHYQQGRKDGYAAALRDARNEVAIALMAIDTWLPPEEHNAVLDAITLLEGER